ncbi:MAG TPA: cyclase family protein, partial [Candidatus Eisenbacteria bacterium]|nr:cyclase family protein [Candidatus Eisenbacteria bacterium]
GDPEVRIDKTSDLAKGGAANVSRIRMGSHTGTHMDAPLHFIRGAKGLDRMPLSATMGPARDIRILDPEVIRPAELIPHRIRRGERILFKTRNSPRCWKRRGFVKDFVYLSRTSASYLAALGVRAVGIDYLSVGGFSKDGHETHFALLKAGIWIIEGLDLTHVKPGRYELACLPLKILKSDGAPARAALRALDKEKHGH